jgi:hypothetical protein
MRSAGAADRASGLEEDTGWMGRNHPWVEYNSREMQEGLFGNVSKVEGRARNGSSVMSEEHLPGVRSASIVRAQFGLVANYLRRKFR